MLTAVPRTSDVLEQMCVEEVNEKDEYGETALYKACRRKNNQAVSLLLAKPGINVNVKNSYYGRTPLYVTILDFVDIESEGTFVNAAPEFIPQFF